MRARHSLHDGGPAPSAQTRSFLLGRGDRFPVRGPSSRRNLLSLAAVLWGVPVLALLAAILPLRTLYFLVVLLVACYLILRPRDGFWLAFVLLIFAVSAIRGPAIRETASDVEDLWVWGVAPAACAAAMSIGLLFAANRRREPSPRRLRSMLVPTFAFAGVFLISIIYGLGLGNDVSTMARQGSGSLLLFAFCYLGARLCRSTEEIWLIVKRVQWLLFAYCVYYLLRYLPANLAALGSWNPTLVREPTNPLLFFSGYCLAVCLCLVLFSDNRRERLWAILTAPIFAMVAVMSGSRSIVGATVVGAAFLLLIKYVKSPVKLGALLVLLGVISFSSPKERLASLLRMTPLGERVASRFLVSAEEDESYRLRVAQMRAVLRELRENPLLGAGTGGTITYENPLSYGETYRRASFVDNGIGFLLLKFGLLGTLVFAWWAIVFLRRTMQLCRGKGGPVGLILLATLVFYLGYLPFGPSFFIFLGSWWIGATMGFILAMMSSVVQEEQGSPTAVGPRANLRDRLQDGK